MKTVRTKYRRHGAAVIELAVLLPVFLLILIGIVEFGRAMMVEQLLANGARLGARSSILEGKTNSEVEQIVADFCATTFADATVVTISVNGVADASLASAQKGDLCQVEVSVAFSDVSLLPTSGWLNSATLRSSCTMEHE